MELLLFFKSVLLNSINATSSPLYGRVPTNGFSCQDHSSPLFIRSSLSRNRPPVSVRVPHASFSVKDGRKYIGVWWYPIAQRIRDTASSVGTSESKFPGGGCLTDHSRPRESTTVRPGLTP